MKNDIQRGLKDQLNVMKIKKNATLRRTKGVLDGQKSSKSLGKKRSGIKTGASLKKERKLDMQEIMESDSIYTSSDCNESSALIESPS